MDHELVRGVERDILKTLCIKLGTSGPSSEKICAELAQESPQVADKRQDLLKKRLEAAAKYCWQKDHKSRPSANAVLMVLDKGEIPEEAHPGLICVCM